MFESGLGVRVDGDVAHAAIWAPQAHSVTLSYVDGQSVALSSDGSGVWRGAGPVQRGGYVFCVDGRRVLDPYARRIEMGRNGPVGHLVESSAATTAKPLIPWHDTVIYEAHVRGLTMLNPEVPPSWRGTYRGVGHPSVIKHLLSLGVTSLELMPVQQFITEPSLSDRGLTNYWGYNPIGYFAPHAAYACEPDRQVEEFAHMVADIHTAGLEVIIDVVYNHTGEGGPGGPDFHLRTLDETGYYAINDGGYSNASGCGNTLRGDSVPARDLILSSLRHWSSEFGVDGFRFDLAGAMIRNAEGNQCYAGSVLEAIAQDEQLGALKLIAEPWDATAEGYCLGGFGPPFRQLNDHFRDDVRDFWRGSGRGVRDLATRLAGSSDVFEGQSPTTSINHVTAHDGFTLRDLVSYDDAHNAANGEDGADGHGDNRSDNCGHEGPTDDPEINGRRQNRARNLLATVFWAMGVPMIGMGDEFGHTQRGNNNAYCQDNATSWVRWQSDEGWDLRDHIAALARTRRDSHHLRRDTFLTDAEVRWFTTHGEPMNPQLWADDTLTFLGMQILDLPDPSMRVLEMDAAAGAIAIGTATDA